MVDGEVAKHQCEYWKTHSAAVNEWMSLSVPHIQPSKFFKHMTLKKAYEALVLLKVEILGYVFSDPQ